MGQGIYGPPNTYPAGLDFDYSVWNPGTRIDLVNVNWDNNYRDTTIFSNRGRLNEYIDAKSGSGITIENMTYAKPGEDIYLGIPYNRVNRYNYLRASNPLMPIDGDIQKDFYYFILDCEYIAPNTTRLRLQLDVWSTYIHDVTIGNCYLERGHAAIANEKSFDSFGRDNLTVPEGFDLGSEYRTIVRRTSEIMGATVTPTNININYDVLVVSTTDLSSDPGTADDPVLKSATGTFFGTLASGADMYVFDDVTGFVAFMNAISTAPWVSQGIISATIIPKLTRYDPDFVYQPLGTPTPVSSYLGTPKKHKFFPNWRNSQEILQWIPERYRHLKKFLTFPYMAIQVTTWTATPIILKPESWNDPDAFMMERSVFMPPGQRVEISPRRYNSSGQEIENFMNFPENAITRDSYRETGDDSGDYLDISTMIANFPTIPVVNNGQLGYLASNVNGIAYQQQSAGWAQQRALGGAQASYDIQTGAMQAAKDMYASGIYADVGNTANTNRTLAAQAAVNASAQAAAGIGTALTPAGAGGSAISGLVNGAASAINAGIQTQANDEALNVRNTQATQNIQTQNKQAGLTRDTNNDLANWSAKGDYANQIAGINARVADAALIQPTTSGQMGGETMNLANGTAEVSVRWKLIDNASIKIIGDFWLRYGYAVRTFMKPPANLKVMTKFSYWKFTESYISGAMIPEGHKAVIRGILEKGVTVWNDPNDIGQIDIADNKPIEGYSY